MRVESRFYCPGCGKRLTLEVPSQEEWYLDCACDVPPAILEFLSLEEPTRTQATGVMEEMLQEQYDVQTRNRIR